MDDQQQALTEHLAELRDRIVNSLYGLVAGFAICYAKSEWIFNIIRKPIGPFLGEANGLVFTAPTDKFMAHIKVSLFGGILLSCPWWLFQFWKFVAPGLYSKEKKYSIAFIFSGTLLFACGVLFVYYLVFPLAFDFLLSYGGNVDRPMITISDYLSFFTTTTVVFGVAFELPLFLTLLGIVGLIDKAFLQEKRRYAVVVLAVVSALITPPDVLSMFLLLIPLYVLYETGVILVGIFGQKNES